MRLRFLSPDQHEWAGPGTRPTFTAVHAAIPQVRGIQH